MSFIEHLEELRSTLIRILTILLISFAICYFIGESISEILLAPLRLLLDGKIQGKIVYLSVLDKVLSHLQLAFWTALILSSPLWFYELWKFIAPALYEHEKRMVRPFVLVGFFLFVLGVVLGHFVVLPLFLETLMGFGVVDVEAAIGLKAYLTLTVKMLVLLGLLFQLPNGVLILGFMGLVTKYSLRRLRRTIYFSLAVVSALLTPADVLTMFGLWLPMIVLYEVGILGVALIVHPYLERQNRDEGSR